MARQSAQHLLASSPPHARRKIPLASSLVRQAFESSGVWSQRQLQNDARAVLEKNLAKTQADSRFQSRSRHYDVNTLSHVCFSCALLLCSFSLKPMAQGFLRCCLPVTGNGFPRHSRATRRCGATERAATDSIRIFSNGSSGQTKTPAFGPASTSAVLRKSICRACRRRARGGTPCGSPHCDGSRPSGRRA